MTNITCTVDEPSNTVHATVIAKVSTASLGTLKEIKMLFDGIVPQPIESSCERDGNTNTTVFEIIIDHGLPALAIMQAILQFKGILAQVVCIDKINIDIDMDQNTVQR